MEKPNRIKLALSALAKCIAGFVAMGALLLLSAGTIARCRIGGLCLLLHTGEVAHFTIYLVNSVILCQHPYYF